MVLMAQRDGFGSADAQEAGLARHCCIITWLGAGALESRKCSARSGAKPPRKKTRRVAALPVGIVGAHPHYTPRSPRFLHESRLRRETGVAARLLADEGGAAKLRCMGQKRRRVPARSRRARPIYHRD